MYSLLAQCRTGTSCPRDNAIAPVEIFRQDEAGAHQEISQADHGWHIDFTPKASPIQKGVALLYSF